MLEIWRKLTFTGFFILLSCSSSYFIINSDLPVNSAILPLLRGFCNEKMENFSRKAYAIQKKIILENSIISCIILRVFLGMTFHLEKESTYETFAIRNLIFVGRKEKSKI